MLSANARKTVCNCQAQSTANKVEGARNSTEDTVYLVRCCRALSLTIHSSNKISPLETSNQTQLLREDAALQAWSCSKVLALDLGRKALDLGPWKHLYAGGGSVLPSKGASGGSQQSVKLRWGQYHALQDHTNTRT